MSIEPPAYGGSIHDVRPRSGLALVETGITDLAI
jgi:hypothetical protein